MKLILISLVALVAVMMVACGGGGGSGPLNVALEDLFQEFVDDVDAASDKYHDKDILVSGEVDSVENAHLVWEKPYINIIVPGASFPSPWVVCLLSDEALSKDISSGDNISVEGKVYIAAMTSLLIEAGPEAFELILNNCSPAAAVAATRTANDVQQKVAATMSAPTPTTAPSTPTTEPVSTVKKVLDKVLPLSESHVNKGVDYVENGQYENAIAEFDKAIQLDPGLADAYYNRGTVYVTLDQLELGIEDLEKATQLAPDDSEAHGNLGMAYARLGEFLMAVERLDIAIQLDPDFANHYKSRALFYAASGKYQLAIQDFDSAIRLVPEYANYYYNRGQIYDELGQLSEADIDFAKACSLESKYC
jgi:tetratricopeptide (TPR) repeat protein